MSDLTVRLAESDDLAAVGDLTVAAYLAGGFVHEGHYYVERLRDAAGRAEVAEVWVAELDGRVVGTVTFCPPGSTHREVAADHEGEFRMLAVSPAEQGRGIARALVAQCFQRCRELGLEQLTICSQPTMTAAHAVYDAFGFERDERLDWFPAPDIELWGYRAPVPAA